MARREATRHCPIPNVRRCSASSCNGAKGRHQGGGRAKKTRSAAMLAVPPVGSQEVRVNHLFFHGLPYSPRYALDQTLAFVMVCTLVGGRARAAIHLAAAPLRLHSD